MKKKKSFIIMGVVLVVIAVIAVLAIFLGRDKKKDDGQVVYVESVSNIMGFGYFGGNRYMGVVETQETTGVDKADDKKVKEIFVKEGDVVREGDKLFEYDTDDMSLKLKQLELELTSIYNNISTLNSQIETLKKEKDQVEEAYKIEYTSQIQSLQAQINQESYNASAKELEIERQKTAIQNSIVYAPIDGVIKEINADASAPSEDYYNPGGSEQHFISIMDMGEYRVKATISEFDVGMFMVGDSVIIRSRVDDSMVWHGTV
ncbi:MAG: efflux RND transporter periplasmic adaptor subunit, partial [Lachnospiraceae bacterium]|nr:efflux RND transporter periplasmic adaptor subunit [Lachnospiraceae bacterium]